MNRDLEALIKALDAYLEASDENQSARLREIYYSRLEDAVADISTTSDELDRLIRIRHYKWKRANEKPPTIPPSA